MELLVLPQSDFVAALTGHIAAGAKPEGARLYRDAPSLTRLQIAEVLSRVSLLSHGGALGQLGTRSGLEHW